MLAKNVILNKECGLNAVESSKLTKIAGKFRCEIFISCDARRVNAKSIMGIMMLAAGKGKLIKIEASGIDAEEAINSLECFFS
nr:HPr family phosphocarrier protein [Candidatus Kinetoplastibacterium desouzaii]